MKEFNSYTAGETSYLCERMYLFIPADVKDFPSGLKNEEIFCPPASPF